MSDLRLLGLDTATRSLVRLRPQLDGEHWGIELRWVARAGLWHLTLTSAAGQLVLDTVPTVASTDLLGGLAGEQRPPGQLWLHDTSGRRAEAGRDDLGRRHRLLYRPRAVVDATADPDRRLV